ncbi:Hypothetical protein D9617_2g059790 [Elsinoe fawcettii]|nr:Hypothetical protein D9617_2g059790 [Elsinoe fawcettii]
MKPLEKGLLSSIRSLYGDTRYSDLVIVCGSKIFHVHKAVICTQSKFAEAACKEHYKEGEDSKIPLPKCETLDEFQDGELEDAVRGMIEFCYGKTNYHYPAVVNDPSLQWLAILYITADRYQIANMKSDLFNKFSADVWKLPTVQHNSTGIDNKAVISLPHLIAFLYKNLPDSDHRLQDVITTWLVHKSSALLFSPAIERLLEEVPDFSKHIAHELRNAHCSPPHDGAKDWLAVDR